MAKNLRKYHKNLIKFSKKRPSIVRIGGLFKLFYVCFKITEMTYFFKFYIAKMVYDFNFNSFA